MGLQNDLAIDQIAAKLLARHPDMGFVAARAEARELWSSPSVRFAFVWSIAPQQLSPSWHSPTPLVQINGFVAEFFAANLLRRLNIPTVESRILGSEDARNLSTSKFIVKFVADDGHSLGWRPNEPPRGWCLVCEVLPDAATMNYICRAILKTRTMESRPADRFYSGFAPSAEQLTRITEAMDVNSEQYLRICVARLFVGCGDAHFGNVLVTRDGQLVSIDHSHAYILRNVPALFEFVGDHPKVRPLLREVARLSADDVRWAVSQIPQHQACGSIAGFAEYFIERLRLWQYFYRNRVAS